MSTSSTITSIPQHVNEISYKVILLNLISKFFFIIQETKTESNYTNEKELPDFFSKNIFSKNKISRNSNNRVNYLNNYSFSKPKNDINLFEPQPDVEEIPTFTFENDRNLGNYKDRIFDKEALIEMNAKNYLNYIKKYERKKTPISSPYSVYLKIKQNNTNNSGINKSDNYLNELINNNTNNVNDTEIRKKNKISNIIINNNYFQNKNKENPINIKSLPNSLSTKSMNFENRRSEISNPELYNKINNEDYNKYRAELRQYLDYNYQILLNKNRFKKNQEVNINPYNPINADFEHYKSDLVHNPILNPVNNYSFNKYLEKEIKNIKKGNTLQQAGNSLFNA